MIPIRMNLVTTSGFFSYCQERQSIVIERDGSTSCTLEDTDPIDPARPMTETSRIEPMDAGEILDAVDRLIMNNPKVDDLFALDTGLWDLEMEYEDGSRRSKQGLAIIDMVDGLRISTAIRHSLRRPDLIVFGRSPEGMDPCVILKTLE